MSQSTESEMPSATKPVEQHKWLEQLHGEWDVVTEMWMKPDEPSVKEFATEIVRSLGGLWSVAEMKGKMPDGNDSTSYTVLGYDVSFNEYRGCFYADMSSHLWKYVGSLSDDGRTMTLNCEGPSMVVDGAMANYRDVIEIVDKDHRTLTAYGEDEKGDWVRFFKSTYTRK